MVANEVIVWALPIVGIALPVSLLIASLKRGELEPSISAHYHQETPMDDIYVGGLLVISVCLMAWRGLSDVQISWWEATLASLAAFVTVISPPKENPKKENNRGTEKVSRSRTLFNNIHICSAVAFVTMLFWFSVRFIAADLPIECRQDVCGNLTLVVEIIIFTIMFMGAVITIAGMIQHRTGTEDARQKRSPASWAIFWGETIIVWGFSLIWIMKAFEHSGFRLLEYCLGKLQCG